MTLDVHWQQDLVTTSLLKETEFDKHFLGEEGTITLVVVKLNNFEAAN